MSHTGSVRLLPNVCSTQQEQRLLDSSGVLCSRRPRMRVSLNLPLALTFKTNVAELTKSFTSLLALPKFMTSLALAKCFATKNSRPANPLLAAVR